MENKTKNRVKILNFNEAYVSPEYKYNNRRNLIEWGKDNQYPIYLLNLYNAYGSTTHKSIINRKVKLTSGQGWEDTNEETWSARNFSSPNKSIPASQLCETANPIGTLDCTAATPIENSAATTRHTKIPIGRSPWLFRIA